ncbi:hypothetical protein INR49_005082 [Caranx melampygus]|nr:hypothetical protein INR49_005082 [Caranx melampygus]
MAASSKSSQKAKNVVLALLLLWSLVSLIIIVVWSTSPDWKGAAQCNKELEGTKETLRESRVVWSQNQAALEEKVDKKRGGGAEEHGDPAAAGATERNQHLTGAESTGKRRPQRNISVLEEMVEQLRETEANLTAQLRVKEGRKTSVSL